MAREIKLKVAEAIQDDVNKGIVRIDTSIMQEIGIRPGDIVEIKGERATVGIADRAYPGDIGLSIIRTDGLIRRNASTGIGESVSVKKADVKEAKKAVIAPARKGIMVRASSNLFKQGLLGRAVVKGDIISLGGAKTRRRTMSESPFFEDIFSMLDESMMGFGLGDIKFIVVDTSPKQAVVISELTDIEFNPEAVELVEEKVPDVAYEDIGGLDEEIKKIREMVELPLKHPEIFERLGIEAPKGVLLHGPPGTGKTLLAKAVANETNANFILINGPEVMCVDGNTKIFTNPEGYVKAKEIFKKPASPEKRANLEIKKLLKPIRTFSFKDGKIQKAKITHVTKLKAPSYAIKLKDGNEIIVSENQPFLVYSNGKLIWKRADELKKGIFVARLNKLKLEEKSKKIDIKNIQNLVEGDGLYSTKSRNLERSNFIRLPEKTSKEILEFLGLIVSEGNISKKGDAITFCNNDPVLRDNYKKLVSEIFGINKFKEYKDGRVVIYSKLLIQFLKILGFGCYSKLKIPAYFYKLPKEEVQAFIRGYFDGDGTVSLMKTKNLVYPTPVLYSRSKEFLQEMQALLQIKLEISSRLSEHRTPKGVMYKITIRGYDGRERFAEIGSKVESKKERLKQIVKSMKKREFLNIPLPEVLINSIREKIEYRYYRNHDFYVYRNGEFTKHALKRLFEIAAKQDIITPEIREEANLLTRDDIAWERIEAIEAVGEKELYDFTVNKDSFVGAPYFLLHNSKFYGESEHNLRKKFEDAEKNAPSIIFIDEVDAIASKREEVHGEVERRVVAQLLALMDGLKSRGKVVVIAATNIPNSLDPALRRPGRFDREIEIGVPGKEGRLNVLKIHTRNMPLAKNVNLKELANITHGFVGADLASLAKEGAMIVLRRILPDLKLDQEEAIPKELLERLRLTQKDFKDALKVVRPSALREVFVEIPNIKWENIGGLEDVKQELKEAVEWPLKNPDGFKRLGVRPPRGILLYGAPGTGKTLLAKAVANESEANFITVKGPELISKWVGDSEKGIRQVFKKARQTSPTIIFFDEIDAIAPRRGMSADSHVTERVVNQILTEMDGLEDINDIVIIGATNRPDMLDTALLRPGRFDRIILTPAPDEKTREEIFKVHTMGMPLKGVDLKELAKKTGGYVGADIEAICREAAINALREDMKSREVTKKHFEVALKRVKASVTPEVEAAYEDLQNFFTAARAKQMKEEKPAYMG